MIYRPDHPSELNPNGENALQAGPYRLLRLILLGRISCQYPQLT